MNWQIVWQRALNYLKFFQQGAVRKDCEVWQQVFEQKVKHYLEQKGITLDSQQKNVIENLSSLYQVIHQPKQVCRKHYGLYLWGGVGTGKTLLMDMFYHLSQVPKIRLHHHELFKKLMQELHQYKNSPHPLQDSIQHFTKQYKLACFDDLHLNDMASAKLWQGVFEQLKKSDLTVFITSNTPPKDLMDTPGYREKIQPLLDTMQKHLMVIPLDSSNDYRTLSQHHLCSEHSGCFAVEQLAMFYEQTTQQTYKSDKRQTIFLQN